MAVNVLLNRRIVKPYLLLRIPATIHIANNAIPLIHSYCLSSLANFFIAHETTDKPIKAMNRTYTNHIAPTIGSLPPKQIANTVCLAKSIIE